MENARIAELIDEIGDLLELQGGHPFKIRSYRNAARTVRDLGQRIEDLAAEGKDLRALPGIGEAISGKIHEMLQTGTCKRLEELRRATPRGLIELLKVPGLGPRKAKLLHDKLKVDSLDALKAACEAGKVRRLPGMGERTEQNILRGLRTVSQAAGRLLLDRAGEAEAALARHVRRMTGIEEWRPAGSFRRRKETIGDLDILVRAKDRAKVVEELLRFGEIETVLARGEERVSVRLLGGLQVDFRFVERASFGAALMYFTGSKAHNIALRRIAQDKGWKLNEYGLFQGDRRLAGAREEEVYEHLGLGWIPPELREDRGEIAAAQEDSLPDLIEETDIQGDLHAHTTATDGKNTVEEMARAAKERGWKYLAITDHSKAVTVAGGLNDDALQKHADRIREADAKMKGFRLFAGVEVDILKDGALDLKEKTLASLDWVVASIHSHFNQDEKTMTARLLASVRSGVVHCLGHPLGRIIGRRDPIRFDLEKVFAACAEAGVCMEIDGQPDRLDLPDTHCRAARDAGVRLAIVTDAHAAAGFAAMPFGVSVARRGWIEKKDVVNALSAGAFVKQWKERTRADASPRHDVQRPRPPSPR